MADESAPEDGKEMTGGQVTGVMDVALAQTERLQMQYRTAGDPQGIPVLLLHGGFASSRWWEPLAAIMPQEVRLIAPDLRGCGGSAQSEAGYTIAEQAEDVAAFVEALGLRNFTLVGHALGAAIAVEYAVTYGGKTDALMLLAPPPLVGVETPPEGVEAFAQMRTDHALLREAMTLLAPHFASESPKAFARLVEDAAGMAPAAFVAGARALADWNRLADAHILSLPTLLVWGDQDPVVDRQSVMRTLVSLPGAENLDIMHGVGHAPMLDDPLGLAERIVEFVTEAAVSNFAEIRRTILSSTLE